MSRPERLFFMHIPKAAGTSLHAMLAELYRPEEICPERNFPAVLLPQQEIDKYSFFSAHAPYDLIYRIPKPAKIVSIFRDPIERSISGYHFLRRFPENRPEPMVAKALSLTEFMNWENRYFREQISNKHFSLLCGHPHLNPDGVPWRGMSEKLDVGFKRIASMDCVGISEYMTASVAAIWRVLGLDPPPSIRELNTRPPPPDAERKEETSPLLRERLEEINQIDISLYAFAKDRFLADPVNKLAKVTTD
jgi:hypothetical protein